MVETLTPKNLEQVETALRWAFETDTPVELVGRGSKTGMGRPVAATHKLDLSGLTGITLYEPEELVMRAGAGTSLAEIRQILAKEGQHLAFEPPNLPLLYGDGEDEGSIGGVFACNLSGPRRLWSGAARDHILGVTVVTGRGETVRSGGRVVKNVTGFDLSKLMAGSFGTLGAIAEVAFKVLPMAETERTILLEGAGTGEATEAMALALRGPFEITGAAYLPADIAAELGHSGALTALRIQGPLPSVEAKSTALRCLLGAFGRVRYLDGGEGEAFWRNVGDASFFADPPENQVWRLSIPPAGAAAVISRLPDELDVRWFLDRAGATVWLSMPPRPHAGQELVRAAIGRGGGHATLIRADDAVRARVSVFQPQPTPLAALSRRVKGAFDPKGILSPGRMVGEG